MPIPVNAYFSSCIFQFMPIPIHACSYSCLFQFMPIPVHAYSCSCLFLFIIVLTFSMSIQRPTDIIVKAQDEKGEPVQLQLGGVSDMGAFISRIFQHEYDHLQVEPN
jgi:hypothetical protein